MSGRDDRSEWLFQQALRRVAPVDRVVAEYATSICGRPARRREARSATAEGELGNVTWSIDGDVVVAFTATAAGRHHVAIYDIGLLEPLRQCLKTRHLLLEYASR